MRDTPSIDPILTNLMRHITHRAGTLMAGVALGLACACGRPPEPGTPGVAAMEVVAGADQADTVVAVLERPLVVEVRDARGRPLPGVVVEFESSLAPAEDVATPMVFLSAGMPVNYQAGAQSTTDATGRAAVRMRMGTFAGPARVRITVPTQGLSGGAAFQVRPGAPVRAAVAPLDTAVYAGSSYTLAGAMEDRYGNQTPIPVSAARSDAPVVAAVSGTSVAGRAPGRTRIVVTAGDAQVPVWVSVVPRGTLAATREDGIHVFGLDGSGMRRVVTTPLARSPRWLPDGEAFVYSEGLGHGWIADLDGATRPLVRGDNPLAGELWPHPSRDGAWIYFGGYAGDEFRGYPYRVRPDGTGLQRVPGFTPDNFTQGHPSPSPAGDRVAYFREEGDSRRVTLRVLNMLTGRVLVRDVWGHTPEWSHGDSLAYVYSQGGERGPIRLMSSTGQGHRQVGKGTTYAFGMDWSPDDQWIVAHDTETGLLEIIRVSTGQRIPLPYSVGFAEPAWKP